MSPFVSLVPIRVLTALDGQYAKIGLLDEIVTRKICDDGNQSRIIV